MPALSIDPRIPRWRSGLPFLLLLALALPDLVAPPISPTIHRQTQTYIQIRQIAEHGFSWDAFSIGIAGPEPFRVIFEFPIYHALAAVLVRWLSPSWFWPKLLSFLATCAAIAFLRAWISRHWGGAVGELAALILTATPIVLLLATAVQPDALALALTAGLLLVIDRWRADPSPLRWASVLVLGLLAVLVKFTVIVPFAVALVWLYVRSPSGLRRPPLAEVATAVLVVVLPFAWWLHLRGQHTDPSFLQLDRVLFIGGDFTRFLTPAFYVKPALILGAMVCAGVGVPLAAFGLHGLDPLGWALVAGLPWYFVAIPTVADQTYYALPLAPVFALMMARGWLAVERRLALHRVMVRALIVLAFVGGLTVALPYTLRQDHVSWDAARSLSSVSAKSDFALVVNMHDRGVGIGGFNPAILVLADRKGWTVSPIRADGSAIAAEVLRRRTEGARWLVATWFTPDLDPWFTRVLPAGLSRQPRLQGEPVDGRGLIQPLVEQYQAEANGTNYVVLRLR